MKSAQQQGQLSWGDALFLYLEREGAPLNIASVSVFDGEIPLDACTWFIESKLPLIPRYYQKVVTPPLNTGLPNWEYDSNFDVRNHVHEVTLKRGSEAELKAVAGKILGQVMDRRMPLWDFTLVRDLKGGRTGVIARVHHCLADGVAGVGLMNVIMDQNPEAPSPPKRAVRFRAPRRRDPVTSLADGLVGSYSNFVERTLTAQADLLTIAQKILAQNQDTPSGQLGQYFPELLLPTERLCFNVTCRGPQKYVWAEMPLADIKKIKEKCGTTVNDVVLAVVTTAIRRYAESHGDSLKEKMLRMMVPVNLRNGHVSELGNRISLLPVSVPLGIHHPRKLIFAVHGRMEFLKRAPLAEFFSLAGNLVGATATALQAIAGPIAGTLPLTVFNLVCTNVPGPQVPLYLMGHKMLHWYPYVPVGGEMAVNCAILTYNGTAYFGFTGDAHAAPDLAQLEKLLRLTIKEFRAMIAPVTEKRVVARTRRRVGRPPTVKSSAPAATIPTQSKPASEPAAPSPAVQIAGVAAAD